MSNSQSKWLLPTIILILLAGLAWRLSSSGAQEDALEKGLDQAQHSPALPDSKLASPDESESVARAHAAPESEPQTLPAVDAAEPTPEPEYEPGVLWIRLQDRQFRNPVPGAQISSHKPNRLGFIGRKHVPFPPTESDAEGMAEIRVPDGFKGIAQVRAPGFGMALVPVLENYEERTRPLTIQLTRSATVTVRMLDSAANPVPHARVLLETHDYELVRPENSGMLTGEVLYHAETDAQGLCTIEDVPSEVPFSGRAILEGGERHEEIGKLVFMPGEHRQLQWGGQPETKLTGRLLDQFGQPVIQRIIWLTPEVMYSKPHLEKAYFYSSDQNSAIAKTHTDDNGQFTFEGVPPGDWWVGPGALQTVTAKPDNNAVAPIAARIQVLGTSLAQDVTLIAPRGLYISGSVSMPDGKKLRGTWVSASCELGAVMAIVKGSFRMDPSEGENVKERQFLAGPLADLEHRLQANGPDPTAPSEAVGALPGADDVGLKLQMGASVVCQTVHAGTQKPCPAVVTISRTTARYLGLGMHPQTEHKFTGLSPGSYNLAASSPNGLFGILGPIDLVAGQNLEDLVIPLSEGTSLRVQYTGSSPFGQFQVIADGAVIAADGLRSGTSTTVVVPPGAVTVELTYRSGEVEKKQVQCELDQTAQVSFTQQD